MHTHKHTHTHARTHTYARTHARMHTHTHTRTHACTHTNTHTRTHARTHTHTHTDQPGRQAGSPSGRPWARVQGRWPGVTGYPLRESRKTPCQFCQSWLSALAALITHTSQGVGPGCTVLTKISSPFLPVPTPASLPFSLLYGLTFCKVLAFLFT